MDLMIYHAKNIHQQIKTTYNMALKFAKRYSFVTPIFRGTVQFEHGFNSKSPKFDASVCSVDTVIMIDLIF